MDHKAFLDFGGGARVPQDAAEAVWVQSLSALTRKLEASYEELEITRRQNRDLRRNTKALKAQLDEITNSSTWRVTAPFRWLLATLKGEGLFLRSSSPL